MEWSSSLQTLGTFDKISVASPLPQARLGQDDQQAVGLEEREKETVSEFEYGLRGRITT